MQQVPDSVPNDPNVQFNIQQQPIKKKKKKKAKKTGDLKVDITEVKPKKAKGKKSTKIEKENPNIIKFLQEKKGFGDDEFDAITSVEAKIQEKGGKQVWDTYKNTVTEYDDEGDPHEVKQLFLKTEVTWTVDDGSGQTITHTQTVYTNVKLPDASEGLDAANDAKRRATLLVKAYNNAFQAPIDRAHAQHEATKARIQEVADETWLNVQVPEKGDNLADYEVKVYRGGGMSDTEGLPSYMVSKNVDFVASPRFSKDDKSDLPDYMSEADSGVIRVKGRSKEYRFRDQVKYKKVDQKSAKGWLKSVRRMRTKDPASEAKYLDHVSQEVDKMEEKFQELRLTMLGSPSKLETVGGRIPVIGKYLEGGAPIIRQHFGKSAAVRLQKKRKELRSTEKKLEKADHAEMLGLMSKRERLEVEVNQMERKIKANKREMMTLTSDLAVVRDKLQFYISVEILDKNESVVISDEQLKGMLAPGAQITPTQRRVVREYVKVSNMLDEGKRAVKITKKDAERVERGTVERKTRAKEREEVVFDDDPDLEIDDEEYFKNIED